MAKRTTRQTPPATVRGAEQLTEIRTKIENLEALVTNTIPALQQAVQETQESIKEIKELLEPEKIKALKGLMYDMADAPAKVTKELHSTINDLRESFERDETLTMIKMVGDNIPTFIELLSTMKAVKGLMYDMADAPAKITKEMHSTINDMRERFEQDEALVLMKKVGDNIPTFVELLGTMEAVKGLMDDMADAPAKITKELHSTINDMRERFERDDVLTMLKLVGDNIPTFVELLSTMQAVKGLVDDMSDTPAKVVKELTPTINSLRERFERDETLAVMKMMGDNIPTLTAALKVMPAFQGLMEDLLPAVEKITKELVPTINLMREAFEKDELMSLLLKTGDHIDTFNQLIDFLTEFKRRGHLDFSLKQALDKEVEYMIKGLESCASKTMLDIEENPLKPSMWTLFKTMNNDEVKKGILLGTTFLRNMHSCMMNAIEEQERHKGAIAPN